MNTTILDINNVFEQITSSHQQINQYRMLMIDDFNALSDVRYVALYLVPIGVDILKKENRYRFNIIVLDKLFQDGSNYINVLDNTRQIVMDVIAEIDRNVMTMRMDNTTISLNDVKDKINNDNVAGWMADVTFILPNELSTCGIPYISPPGIILSEDGSPILLEN